MAAAAAGKPASRDPWAREAADNPQLGGSWQLAEARRPPLSLPLPQVLYNLYLETGDPDAAACAALFDKPNFFEPLVAGKDTLPGRHANTHLAQVNGFGARYEATGDAAAAAAVKNFFALALRVSYSLWGVEEHSSGGAFAGLSVPSLPAAPHVQHRWKQLVGRVACRGQPWRCSQRRECWLQQEEESTSIHGPIAESFFITLIMKSVTGRCQICDKSGLRSPPPPCPHLTD